MFEGGAVYEKSERGMSGETKRVRGAEGKRVGREGMAGLKTTTEDRREARVGVAQGLRGGRADKKTGPRKNGSRWIGKGWVYSAAEL